MTAPVKLRSICVAHKRYHRGCDGCREATAAWGRNRARMMAYGRWAGNVDAAECRAHIEKLVSTGLSLKAISDKAGVAGTVVKRVRSGATKKVRAATAAAILAITYSPAPDTLVSSLGTARRLQALMAIGWDSHVLGAYLNVAYQQVGKWRYQYMEQIPHHVHVRVADLYRALECRSGPSKRAIVQASVQCYAPPVCWDGDDDIDNPATRPKGLVRRLTTPTRERTAA